MPNSRQLTTTLAAALAAIVLLAGCGGSTHSSSAASPSGNVSTSSSPSSTSSAQSKAGTKGKPAGTTRSRAAGPSHGSSSSKSTGSSSGGTTRTTSTSSSSASSQSSGSSGSATKKKSSHTVAVTKAKPAPGEYAKGPSNLGTNLTALVARDYHQFSDLKVQCAPGPPKQYPAMCTFTATAAGVHESQAATSKSAIARELSHKHPVKGTITVYSATKAHEYSYSLNYGLAH